MDTQIVEAKTKSVRITARKLRLVADTVRGKDALEGLDSLRFLVKRGSLPIYKTLKSAIANAEHNYSLKAKDLYVKEIYVNEGPTYKRMRPVSRGRGHAILKRTSSITIKLDTKK